MLLFSGTLFILSLCLCLFEHTHQSKFSMLQPVCMLDCFSQLSKACQFVFTTKLRKDVLKDMILDLYHNNCSFTISVDCLQQWCSTTM